MTDDLALFARPAPPPVVGVDLRCADVSGLLREVRGAALVHADPPWTYANAAVCGSAQEQYDLLDMAAIVEHLDAAYDCARPDARLVLWATWPLFGDLMSASSRMRWRYVTGGSWHKVGAPGVGFHWLGNSEPVLIFVKGSPWTRRAATVTNAHQSDRQRHSEKPSAWLGQMLRRWTQPDDLVLDLYAGMAPMARACALSGRRYVGAEIDAARHADALGRLALAMWRDGGSDGA